MAKDSKIVQRIEKLLSIRKEQNSEAQIAEAEQIVHAIEKIDSREAFTQVQKRIQKHKSRKRFLLILTRAAAIFSVPLLITSVLFFYKVRNQSTPEQFAMQQISNPPGVRSEIVLPDSSKVWLNAESSISYKIPFDFKSRDVKLVGEAFFEVKEDKHKPFQVESGNVNVTVLGTRFNCKAFPEDKEIEVVLAEGKVELNSVGSKTGKGIILNPGERAIINKVTNRTYISAGNIDRYIGWHEGKLIFEECPLPEVARQLERWFGIEVEIADAEILSCHISTTFENESLYQILTLLELASPIKTTLIPATFEKETQTKSREKVIITSKN
jgi:ferric-dicitrate binding protein FerR (iron transport regulator)